MVRYKLSWFEKSRGKTSNIVNGLKPGVRVVLKRTVVAV